MEGKILKTCLSQNKSCTDCEKEPVTHISIQNGITLCSDCAKEHEESMDQEESWVRSIEGEEWPEHHLMRLECGGNEKFNEFVMNDFLNYESLREKYTCVLAIKWREQLVKDSGIE